MKVYTRYKRKVADKTYFGLNSLMRMLQTNKRTNSCSGPQQTPIKSISIFNEYDSKKPSAVPNGDNFHESIRGTLAVSRALGLFPLHGVLGNPSMLRFRPCSVLTILSGLATLPVLWMALTGAVFAGRTLAKARSDTSGGVVNKMAGCIFYTNAWISALLLRGIAKGWPLLMAQWRFEELRAASHRAPPLKRKIISVAIIILFFAIIEHWLSILVKTTMCQASIDAGNATFQNCLHEYCMISHGFIFKVVNYSTFLGVFVVLTSEIATFTWNFQDLFLIQISIALVIHFKHINIILRSMDIQNTRPSEWKYVRELFCGGLDLTRQTANLLGPLVLLSFSNNLFFICLQMFNGISPGPHSVVYKMYFFGSFVFMVCRVTSVALAAAGIPLESKKFLPMLRCCPSNAYCQEVNRLCHQLVYDDVSLSGMGFFTVNRNFMLGVAGAIATYEVVLLQFV